jgi:hypothetical protein
MIDATALTQVGVAGAFGVNYALRLATLRARPFKILFTLVSVASPWKITS